MPRPKGFEPYTNLYRVNFEGLYVFSPTFSQIMNATIWTHTNEAADGWVSFFTGLQTSPTKIPYLRWRNVKKDGPLKWFNKADSVCSQLNGIVPTIFCGVSGFSIG